MALSKYHFHIEQVKQLTCSRISSYSSLLSGTPVGLLAATVGAPMGFGVIAACDVEYKGFAVGWFDIVLRYGSEVWSVVGSR